MRRHFGFPTKPVVRAHPWNRPLAKRHLPVIEQHHTWPVATVLLIAIAVSIVGTAIGLAIFLAPIFIPHY